MTKKNPDKIYIANLSATGANGKLYNVMQQNTFTVDKTDTTKYTFKVNMDWNGFDAGKVEVKDGKLVIAFEDGETGKANVKKGTFKILDGKGLSIGPYGKIEIPLTDIQNAEWSGYFGAKAGVSEFLKYNHTHWIFTPTGVSIPVNVKVALSGDLESLFNVSGTLQNPKFSGEITPALELDAFGGVGLDYDSVVAKIGVYGTLKGELAIILLTEKAMPEFEPAAEGEIGVRGEVKVWIWEAKGEEQAGKFRWDKDGFKASWLGFDVLMLSIENDDNSSWQLAGRKYLENGGGFTGGGFSGRNNITLFDLEVTNKDEQIIYNNIFHNAEAVLQNINDKKYLIYTVDDIEREEQNGLKLVFSEKLSDGSWSEPTPIDDDGTLDSIISADDKFVA